MTKFSHIATGGGQTLNDRCDPIAIRTMKGFLLQDNTLHSTVLKAGTCILNVLIQPYPGHVPAAGTVSVGTSTTTATRYASAVAITAFSLPASATVEQLTADARLTIQATGLSIANGEAVWVAVEVIEPGEIPMRR